jgi:transposase-like protein
MERKSKFSTDEKLEYVLSCIEGKTSIKPTATMIGVNEGALRQWICNYQSLGIVGLCTTSKNSYYPAELKEMAVKDYLDDVGSLSDICRKYGIKSN